MLLALLVAACDRAAPAVHRFAGPTMGSTYEVKYVAPAPRADVRLVVDAELAAADLAFSNWRDDSEIARCNRHRDTTPFPASPRFLGALRLALDLAEQTDGAFDPTVKPLSDVYRKAKADPAHRLDPAALAAARAHVGFRAVSIQDGAVCKQDPDLQLDLDGIVAGLCCDAIAARLLASGVDSFYLEITGEVLCRGEKAPGQPWRIGVADPGSDRAGGNEVLTSVPLRDAALCTSGDYRNAILVEGRVVHHIFDPRTGDNPRHDIVSVSVLAPSAGLADGLGTALLVTGLEGAERVLAKFGKTGPIGLLFVRLLPDGRFEQARFAWPD